MQTNPQAGAQAPKQEERDACGRSGAGVASILPHLQRQQRINDKPAAAEPLPRGPQRESAG